MADNDTRPSKATPIGPGDPVEAEAFTGRPADTAPENTTFADRAKANKAATRKAVASDTAEDKAVSSRKTARK